MNAVEFFKTFGYKSCKLNVKANAGINTAFWQDLKRLVDSWEMVERCRGINRSKLVIREWENVWSESFDFYMPQSRRFHRKPKTRTIELIRLKQAIRDVESVGGGV